MNRRPARRVGLPEERFWCGRVAARAYRLSNGQWETQGCPTTPAGRYAAAHWLAGLLGGDVEAAYSRLWGEPNPFERTT